MTSPAQAYRTYKQSYAPYFTTNQFGQLVFNPLMYNPQNVFNRYQLAENLSDIYSADKNAAAMARGEMDSYIPSGQMVFTDSQGYEYTPEAVSQMMEAASNVGGAPVDWYYNQIGRGDSLPEVEVIEDPESLFKTAREAKKQVAKNKTYREYMSHGSPIPLHETWANGLIGKAIEKRNNDIVDYIKNHYNTPDSVWRPYVDDGSARDIYERASGNYLRGSRIIE